MVVKQKSETKVKEEREISPIDRDICQWEGDFLNYNRRYAIVSGGGVAIQSQLSLLPAGT